MERRVKCPFFSEGMNSIFPLMKESPQVLEKFDIPSETGEHRQCNSETLLLTYANLNTDAMVVFARDLVESLKFANDRFRRLFEDRCGSAPDLLSFASGALPSSEKRDLFIKWCSEAISGAGETGERLKPKRWIFLTRGGQEREMVVSGIVRGELALLSMRDVSRLRRQIREKVNLAREKKQLEEDNNRLERELNEQQKQIDRTLDSLVDPLVIMSPQFDERGLATDWIIDYANPSAGAYWKVDNRAVGLSLKNFVSPQHTLPVLSWCRDVLSTGDPLSINDYAYGDNIFGEERRFDIRISRVDGRLSWTWRDVTEKFKAAGRISESEERYRLLAHNSSDVVVSADKNKIVRWVSPSVKEVLGWDFQDWIGRPCSEFLSSKEEMVDFEKHSSSVSRNGQPERFRKQIKSKNGETHWVEAHTGPYVGSDGQVRGTVTSFRTVDEQVRMEEELLRLARLDELTKLLNRREGMAHLEKLQNQVERTGESLAVLFVDFDNFKSINDTYGHVAGDHVLRTIGKRIHTFLRTEDDVGVRVGGDEMLVVLHGVHGMEDALAVAEKLRHKISSPITFQGVQIVSTVSIGVALAQGSETPEKLTGRADEAMYQAKLGGRDQVVAIPGKSSEVA